MKKRQTKWPKPASDFCHLSPHARTNHPHQWLVSHRKNKDRNTTPPSGELGDHLPGSGVFLNPLLLPPCSPRFPQPRGSLLPEFLPPKAKLIVSSTLQRNPSRPPLALKVKAGTLTMTPSPLLHPPSPTHTPTTGAGGFLSPRAPTLDRPIPIILGITAQMPLPPGSNPRPPSLSRCTLCFATALCLSDRLLTTNLQMINFTREKTSSAFVPSAAPAPRTV